MFSCNEGIQFIAGISHTLKGAISSEIELQRALKQLALAAGLLDRREFGKAKGN